MILQTISKNGFQSERGKKCINLAIIITIFSIYKLFWVKINNEAICKYLSVTDHKCGTYFS